MLEEAVVEILLEAVLELDVRRLPDHVVDERYLHARLEADLLLARQVDVHNVVLVVADLELLACPQVVGVLLLVVLAHNAPHGQIVDVHLIPVVVLDGVDEQIVLLLGEIDRAELGLGVRVAEGDEHAAVLELDAEEILAECLVVVVDGLLGSGAEGQREVRIGLLAIVIWPDGVRPQHHLLVDLVLVIVFVAAHHLCLPTHQNGQS